MGKKKLIRFSQMQTYSHVVQPEFEEIFRKDYQLKGRWGQQFFKNNKPIVLELGCGKGEYTIGLAKCYQDKNFLGIDIKGARMWRGAKTAVDENIKNAGFLRTRIDFINSFFKEDEVSEIWVTFPDPQPKKYQKRLTSTRFLGYYQKFIVDNGIIHLKTDNADLYYYTKSLAEYNKLEVLDATDNLYANRVDEILAVQTFYEKQFLGQGKPIHYLKFRLKKDTQLEEPDEKQ